MAARPISAALMPWTAAALARIGTTPKWKASFEIKKVNGMLKKAMTTARHGPIHAGPAANTPLAMASAILVPCGLPRKIPAAKTSDTTGSTLAACGTNRAFSYSRSLHLPLGMQGRQRGGCRWIDSAVTCHAFMHPVHGHPSLLALAASRECDVLKTGRCARCRLACDDAEGGRCRVQAFTFLSAGHFFSGRLTAVAIRMHGCIGRSAY